jgi:hypothetical protein
MKKTLFYYSQLPNKSAKFLYRSILQSIGQQKNSVYESKIGLSDEEIRQVLLAIDRDYPELFYVSFFGKGCSYTLYKNGDREIKFRYRYSKSDQEKKISKNEKLIRYLVSHIPDKVKSSEYLTALWLHDLIAMNIEYDCATANENDDKKCEGAYLIDGCLNEKKAVCSGIARLYMMLCEYMELWCAYIVGPTFQKITDREKNIAESRGWHAWNLLNLNGVYTYVDVTWDLQDEKSDYISHVYFGMSDEQCRIQHEPVGEYDSIHIPRCPNPNQMNYYNREHCNFQNSRQLEQFILSMLERKQKSFSFQLESHEVSQSLLYKRTQGFVNDLLNKHPHLVKSWKCWCNEPTFTFYYEIKYK